MPDISMEKATELFYILFRSELFDPSKKSWEKGNKQLAISGEQIHEGDLITLTGLFAKSTYNGSTLNFSGPIPSTKHALDQDIEDLKRLSKLLVTFQKKEEHNSFPLFHSFSYDLDTNVFSAQIELQWMVDAGLINKPFFEE